jgi:ABC-type branched-subunit amino acid transport system substrate-binding protein
METGMQGDAAHHRSGRTWHRPWVRGAAALVSLVALGAAACAPPEGPAQRPPDREPVEVDASLGVVRIPAGSPVLVRIVIDGDDDPEGLGAVLEAAFRAAVEDFGAVQQGFRVDLGVTRRTSCDRASGEEAGAALAAEADADGLVAVLGPQCSETLLGLQGAAADAGLVVVTPRPQLLTLTEGPDGIIGQDRSEGTWRTAPSLLQEARAAADYAATDLELSRAVTLHDGSVESAGLAEAFRTRFEGLGGTVIASLRIDEALTSDDPAQASSALETALDAVARAEGDVAFLALSADQLLAISGGWIDQRRLAGIVRVTTSAAATLDVLADDTALGLVLTGPLLGTPEAVSAVTGMSAGQSIERIRTTSGVAEPPGWWAHAYDAGALLLKAIEDSSLIDVDGSFVLSRAELRSTLGRTAIGGFTGRLACTPLGDCASPRIAIRVHEDLSHRGLEELPVVALMGD